MSGSSCSAANVFIDLATYSEVESTMYGGSQARTWFVAAVQPSNWFAFIPIQLRSCGAQPAFGQKGVTYSVNRSGDYVLSIWFRVGIPQVIIEAALAKNADASVRWTRKLGHNLFSKVSIVFNELVVQEFESNYMDNMEAFCLDAGKQIGYRNMIGDIAAFTTPVGPGVPLGTGGYITCPLPFFFSEDTGLALPIAALPFNDVKVSLDMRPLQELLVVYPGSAGAATATVNDVTVVSTGARPELFNPVCYAHYVVVHNDERVQMGNAPRDMLICQQQTSGISPFKDISTSTTFDLRFSHAIKAIMFSAKNTSVQYWNSGAQGAEQSNYTTEPDYAGLDPFAHVELRYDNTCRVSMSSDYFSLIAPYYFSKDIPDETGYHLFSFALHPFSATEPSGSTNFSRLSNVSISFDASDAAKASAGIGTVGGVPEDQAGNPIQWPTSGGVLTDMKQSFALSLVVVNWNVVRVANGSLGQPIL